MVQWFGVLGSGTIFRVPRPSVPTGTTFPARTAPDPKLPKNQNPNLKNSGGRRGREPSWVTLASRNAARGPPGSGSVVGGLSTNRVFKATG